MCGISPVGGGCHWPLQNSQVSDPSTGEQLYNKSSHTVAKFLGSTTDLPNWGSAKGLGIPRDPTCRSVGFDHKTFTGMGKHQILKSTDKPCVH